MLLTLPSRNLKRVLEIFEAEDVEAAAIGKLTADGILHIYYESEKVGEMEVSFLFEPPRTKRKAEYTHQRLPEPDFEEPENYNEMLLRLLSSPNIASKEKVVRTYDHEVKGNTVLKPLQGEYAGPNDAAVIKLLDASWKGIVISCGMNPNFGKIDAYWMAASVIDEAVRNNVAVGGRRIALLDNFTWGNPEKPERLGSLVRACEACYDVSTILGTPFISGKDSLYNESSLGPVTPTLLITALGILPDVRSTVSLELKKPNDLIYIVGETLGELGGSEYYRLKGFLGKTVPKLAPKKARKTYRAITKVVDAALVKACHDLSEGGLAVSAAEMAFTGGYGLEVDLRKIPREPTTRNDFVLFSESNSRFLVEVSEEAKRDFEDLMRGTKCAEIGTVIKAPRLDIVGLDGEHIVDVSLDNLRRSWKQMLSSEA